MLARLVRVVGVVCVSLCVSAISEAAKEVVALPGQRSTDLPNILVAGGLVTLESALDYHEEGATTTHTLAVIVPAVGSGSLEVVAEGDFDSEARFASVRASHDDLHTARCGALRGAPHPRER